MSPIRVLFVCMGNICRSPTAEGVFARLVKEQGLETVIEIDSAGTHAYHIGEQPDHRAQQAALARGIELHHLRARKVTYGDFEDFDYLLAMDDDNLAILRSACPEALRHKLHLLLDFAPETGVRAVPDPYYGGAQGFEQVLDLVEAGGRGFLAFLHDKINQ
ncbi:MAG: low molecular weight protein-tyrosine-phosphatase [Methylococcales bacterium]|nr:low molecular weight protein-tyrosine-phosphatase [Methylococcales bacterium]